MVYKCARLDVEDEKRNERRKIDWIAVFQRIRSSVELLEKTLLNRALLTNHPPQYHEAFIPLKLHFMQQNQ